MIRKIGELSPKEVLALAIHIEQANGRRLRHFADAFSGRDGQVTEKFQELAEEERQHEIWLTEKFKRRFKGPIPSISEFDVKGVVEAVEWDDSEHAIFGSLTPDQVFRLALVAENNARRFYEEAESTAIDKSLRLLFRQLGAMENDHAGWLEKKIQGPDKKNARTGAEA